MPALKRFYQLDKEIESVARYVQLSHFNPRNLKEEKRLFFKSNTYNPVFSYPASGIPFERCFEQLNALQFEQTPLDALFKAKARELFILLRMIQGRGTERFTRYSMQVYGAPDPQLLSYARQVARDYTHKVNETPRTFPTEAVLNECRRTLDALGLQWKVIADDIVANAMVIPSHKTFVIKEGTPFSKRQVKRFIAHEIFCHILRAECGEMQPFKIFRTGLAGYDATEEGLALYKEKQANVLDSRILRGYAGRVLAIHLALHYSFRKTYLFLRSIFSKDKAWELAVRVKRGLRDTSLPGAFTKDMIYLKGFLEVERFAQQHGSVEALHYGKIGIHHVPLMFRIQQLKTPAMIWEHKFKNCTKYPRTLFW